MAAFLSSTPNLHRVLGCLIGGKKNRKVPRTTIFEQGGQSLPVHLFHNVGQMRAFIHRINLKVFSHDGPGCYRKPSNNQ